MKAIYKTENTIEERLLVSNNLSHPGADFKIVRIETIDLKNQFLEEGHTQNLLYKSGSFVKQVNMHVLPLLGLVQGKTATLAEEDTYALFLGESNQVMAVNIGYNQPDQYILLDYSQFEKLISDIERINFWVAITNQTSWPLVKFNLYEGYGKQLNHAIFTGFRVNNGKATTGHYYYSTVELSKTEKNLFDTGVFLNHINEGVLAGDNRLAIPA